MSVQISFKVEPDAKGVYDGRELARLMIADAYKLLVPYAGGCLACADDLFTAIGNEEIERVHVEKKESGKTPGLLMASGPDGPEKDAAIREHLQEARPDVERLLGVDTEDSGPAAPGHAPDHAPQVKFKLREGDTVVYPFLCLTEPERACAQAESEKFLCWGLEDYLSGILKGAFIENLNRAEDAYEERGLSLYAELKRAGYLRADWAPPPWPAPTGNKKDDDLPF